jgi:hypothetical protein
MSGMVSPSGVNGGSSFEAEVGDNGPAVDVRRNEVLRILDWREREGWWACAPRVLARISVSSPTINRGEELSGDWTVPAPADGGAFLAALMTSLNAASSGSVSA